MAGQADAAYERKDAPCSGAGRRLLATASLPLGTRGNVAVRIRPLSPIPEWRSFGRRHTTKPLPRHHASISRTAPHPSPETDAASATASPHWCEHNVAAKSHCCRRTGSTSLPSPADLTSAMSLEVRLIVCASMRCASMRLCGVRLCGGWLVMGGGWWCGGWVCHCVGEWVSE